MGLELGVCVGTRLGVGDGRLDGAAVGLGDGNTMLLGVVDGLHDGRTVGLAVFGEVDGEGVGLRVGARDGIPVTESA